ncbi:MAG: hypothetical protein ACTHK1_08185 [Actinomycetales bacterium]
MLSDMQQTEGSSRRWFDRMVGWVLDPDGEMYGDERERLRYYESSAFAATTQGVLIPWALAVTAILGGRAVAPYVLALAAIFMLPWLVAKFYLQSKRVHPVPKRVTPTYVVLVVLAALPYAILVVAAMTALQGEQPRDALETIAGAAVGGTVGAVIGLVLQRRRRAKADARLEAEESLADAELDA